MHRAIGVALVVVGLAVVQFSGVLAFHSSGGIDVEDLLSFRWLSNLMDFRLRGDGGLFVGLGVLGLFMVVGGVVKTTRGKKKKQESTGQEPPSA